MDTQGGIYFSDSGDFEGDWTSGRPAGALYYLKSNGELRQVDAGIRYPNGLALSPEGHILYVNEHRSNRVLRYTIDDDGKLSNRSVFFELDNECLLSPEQSFEMGPDGCCVDDLGYLYLAHYGGGKIIKVGPDGVKAAQVFLPHGRKPTSCCFQAQQQALYVTEAEEGLLYLIGADKQ